jgi:Holliday junction resolvase RusA-like endonuclease
MKVHQVLWIPECLPSLNELIGGKVHDRIVLKRQWRDVVVALAQSQKLRPVGPARMRYDFWERTRKRDLSNLFAGAVKIIEDGLVRARVLVDDSQKYVRRIEFGDVVINPERPGVLVTIDEL